MSRLFTVAPFLLGFAFLSSPAAAGCREDPRNVELGEEVARLKAYNCSVGGASAASGVKVEFYSFSPEAVAMLASGRPMPSIANILGKPEVLTNAVFAKFKYIMDTFGSTWTQAEGTYGGELGLVTEVNGLSFSGTTEGTVSLVSVKNEIEDYPATEILQINQKIIPDSISVYYGCDDSSFSEDIECPEWADRSAVIWRYGSLEDIANFRTNVTLLSEAARANKGHALWSEVGSEAIYDKSHELLKYLAGSIGLPQTFLILAGVYVLVCGGDESSFWYFAMSTPKIALEAALVRNATGSPVRIDSIMGEEVADGPLRIADDAAPTGVQPISLGITIQPGHSLLVPTRISLKPNPSYQLFHDASVGSAATYKRLRSKGFTARDNVFAVPDLDDFVFGPELKVAGLSVEGNAIDFREKPLNDMEIAFSAQVGSCPYLLSWDDARADWTQHGKVLHEASDISREETQTITLPGFVSRFRLEEREPEVATISDAVIAFSLRNGGSITLTPDSAPSAKAGKQLLFWGDALELEFSLPSGIAPADVVQSRLSLTGYYERYSSLPNSAYRGAAFSSDTAFSTGARLPALGVGPSCRASAATTLNMSTAVSSPANFARQQ